MRPCAPRPSLTPWCGCMACLACLACLRRARGYGNLTEEGTLCAHCPLDARCLGLVVHQAPLFLLVCWRSMEQ